ncbi:MAG: hypothetical protein AB7V50_04865 [Vampirovibrionia bacterium]
MTLNRLYNFSPGQTIQSAQVNAEFDQLITTVNSNVLDANFSSNNIIADGNIVTALGTLDSYLGDNPPGGVIAYNYSRNVIFNCDDYTTRVIYLNGSDINKIVFSRDTDAFLDNTIISLTLPTSEGFHDIYIEEDTLNIPLIDATKRIKLVSKFADDTPYSTSADSGQYIVGCAYIYDDKILGYHCLETPSSTTFSSSAWSTDGNFFNLTLSSTATVYSSNICMLPIFVPSAVQYSVQTQYYTTGSGDTWNFNFRIKYDEILDFFSTERLPTLDPSSDMGRTGRTFSDRRLYATPGVHEIKFGGELGSDDTYKCNVVIEKLYALFLIYPMTNAFKAN